jgi:immunoglobulin-binding protein 1
VFRANVFGSSIAPPTMTLEEFADLEIQGAREREERERIAAASQENATGKRYSHLLAEGLEDDEELVNESAKHDQAWDDWKDHNPKGSGNKMGKRF